MHIEYDIEAAVRRLTDLWQIVASLGSGFSAVFAKSYQHIVTDSVSMLNSLPQVKTVYTACEAVIGRTDMLFSSVQPLCMSLHTMIPWGF
jgi:hypothetical protein